MKATILILTVAACAYNPRPLTWSDGLGRCACPRQIQVVDMTGSMQISIQAAMQHWNQIIGRAVFTDEPAGSKVFVMVVNLDDPDTKALAKFQRSATAARGCLELLEIRIAPDTAERDWRLNAVTMAHELGHILGLGHSPYPASLMYIHASSMRNAIFRIPDLELEEVRLVRAMWR